MIPVFVALMLISVSEPMFSSGGNGSMSESYFLLRIGALFVFCLAAFTDFLDGYIAREYDMITNFGKFMDPLADKLLVCSALILLSCEGSLSPIVTIVIVAREFIISGFRLVASDSGVVIAASIWGKLKTVTQMIMCILLILPYKGEALELAAEISSAAALILTIVSLIDYIRKNGKLITEGGM